MGFFVAAARRVWLRSSYDRDLREPFVWPQGSPVSIPVARWSVAMLLSQGTAIRPQDALKRESLGLS